MFVGKTKILFLVVVLIWTIPLMLEAQIPTIYSLSVNRTTVNEKITISGNNFPGNPANLRVFFGSVAGNVISTSLNSIDVEVPAGTITDNVVVINTSNGLSSSSATQFYLSYSGNIFDPLQLDPEVDYASSVELFDLCLCDFDNDGKSDVATTRVNTETDILVYENNSTIGSINLVQRNKTTNPELDLGSPTSNITCGDLDGNGLPDLIVSKTGNPRNLIYVLRNISSGGNIRFAPAKSYFLSVDEIAKRIEVKDLDLDGKPEIIVSNTFNENLKIFQNTSSIGNIQFNPVPVDVSITGAITTNGLVVEDINGDQLPDLITCPFFENNIYIQLNYSSQGNFIFSVPQIVNVTGNLNVIAPGDFDNDGKIDLAVTKTVQNEVTILRNTTPEGSAFVNFDRLNLSTDGNPWGINATDMDGNGKLDLIVGIRDVKSMNVFENTGSGSNISFQKHSVTTNFFSRNVVGGDIDGDAIPDLVFTSFDPAPQYALSVIRNANCYKPIVRPAGPLSLCAGATIELSARKGIGITYSWDKDNVVFKTGSEDTIVVTQPGVYKVIAESASGACTEISNAVIINPSAGSVPADPVIYNNGPFCQGSSIVLTTDSIAGASFLWLGPDNFSSFDQNVSVTNASPAKAGVYSLQVSVGNCSSNVSTTTVELISFPSFLITASSSTKICEGGSVQLTVNQVAGYTYQWYLNGQPIVGGVGSTYLATAGGTYHVEITQTSTLCTTSSSNTMDVNVITVPVADFYYTDPRCTGNQMQFINSSTFESGESVGYSWDFGDGSFIVNNENPIHTYNFPGDYTITFVVAYTQGTCRDTLQYPISINPPPVFSIIQTPDATICEGDPLNLATSQVFNNYLWNTGQTTQQITIYRPGDYAVTVTDNNGCLTQQNETITMWPKPEVTATAVPEETVEDSEVELHATGALSYLWRPGDLLDNPLGQDPVATVSQTTEFTVIGENAEGCRDTASVVVQVLETNTLNVTPRKVFSPNGDGIDDYWTIDNIENYPEAIITIYNGNGSVVYESKNYNNTWDAVYKGNDLPETAYFYVIRYGIKNPKTGSVTVIR